MHWFFFFILPFHLLIGSVGQRIKFSGANSLSLPPKCKCDGTAALSYFLFPYLILRKGSIYLIHTFLGIFIRWICFCWLLLSNAFVSKSNSFFGEEAKRNDTRNMYVREWVSEREKKFHSYPFLCVMGIEHSVIIFLFFSFSPIIKHYFACHMYFFFAYNKMSSLNHNFIWFFFFLFMYSLLFFSSISSQISFQKSSQKSSQMREENILIWSKKEVIISTEMMKKKTFWNGNKFISSQSCFLLVCEVFNYVINAKKLHHK